MGCSCKKNTVKTQPTKKERVKVVNTTKTTSSIDTKKDTNDLSGFLK